MTKSVTRKMTIAQRICEKKKLFYFTAFILPFILLLIIYIANEVYPFGGRGVSLVDSFHQYVPFMSDFQNKLQHGGSFMYSFNGGLGYNFSSVMSYYLMSPINLILAFIPKSQIITFFGIGIMTKVSLSSMAFSFYMSKKLEKRSIGILIFGFFYAFCGWVIGYNWNIMWLDCLALLPLIIYGLEKLIDKGKGTLYGIFLGISVICNYYISISICIFIVLYFFMYYFSKKRDGVVCFLKAGFKTLLYSILGVGMGAVAILPAYYTLQTTYSSANSFPFVIKFYHSFFDTVGQLFALNPPTKVDGLPNLYSGVIVLIAIVLFVFYKGASRRRKVLTIGLLAFLVFSTNFRMFDYIWHGFHFPNDLPARFTFMFSFLALAVACEVFMHIRSFSLKAYAVAWIVPMVVCVACAFMAKESSIGMAFIITAVLICVYVLLMILGRGKGRAGRPFYKLLMFVLVVEVVVNTAFGISYNGTMNRDQYVEYVGTADEINKKVAEIEGENFYRTEMYKNNARNNAMFLGFRSHSLFSSTLNWELQKLMGKLGFFSAANKFTYNGATPVTDAMFGIKYLMVNVDNPELRTFEKYFDSEKLYFNPYALSLGYMVTPDYLDWVPSSTNPFIAQNAFAKKTAGITEDIFVDEGQIMMVSSNGAESIYSGGSSYTIKETSGDERSVSYVYENTDGRSAYLYFKGKDCEKVTVVNESGKNEYKDLRGFIIPLGNTDADIKVTLASGKNTADVTMNLVTMDDVAFTHFYEALSDEQLKVTEFNDSYIKGEIDVKEDGIMFTTIVYDKGWSFFVDGSEVEVESLDGALAHIKLAAGHHVVEMKFVTPGLKLGLLGSIGCFIIIILLFLLQKALKKRSICKKDFTNNN